MSLAEKPITADELLAMGDIGRCELIYGELIMMSPAGAEHGVVALRIASFLTVHVDENDLGLAFAAETGFRMGSDLVRAPDASFVRKRRLIEPTPKGFYPSFPDLAVEVVSPDDRKRDLLDKVNMWLAYGTSVVWVADPRTMTLAIHRVGQPARVLNVGDVLRDEPLLPGFELPLSKVFRIP